MIDNLPTRKYNFIGGYGKGRLCLFEEEFIVARHSHITKCMLGKYICTVGFILFLGLSSHNNL